MPRDQVTEIVSEMVANVLRVEVEAGAVVDEGDELVLLESMKMEIPVFTEVAGVVRAVKVSGGDVVQDGDVLVEIVPS
ncbi:MAG: biotin/lipoyl-binding carrier protein [Nocardioides sp.]|jgi:biotin carboxyl carrier protein